MNEPPEQHPEPAPASEAPEVIHLLPPPELARPKKARHGSNNRRRKRMAFFRYDDAEYAELDRRRRDAGMTISAYGRHCTIGPETTPPRRRPRRIQTLETEALMKGVAAYNRAENNHNQIARTGNAMMLFAEEHGCEKLAAVGRDLVRSAENSRADAAPLIAALLAALDYHPQR